MLTRMSVLNLGLKAHDSRESDMNACDWLPWSASNIQSTLHFQSSKRKVAGVPPYSYSLSTARI